MDDVGREGSGGFEGLGFEEGHCASSDAELELGFCMGRCRRAVAQRGLGREVMH